MHICTAPHTYSVLIRQDTVVSKDPFPHYALFTLRASPKTNHSTLSNHIYCSVVAFSLLLMRKNYSWHKLALNDCLLPSRGKVMKSNKMIVLWRSCISTWLCIITYTWWIICIVVTTSKQKSKTDTWRHHGLWRKYADDSWSSSEENHENAADPTSSKTWRHEWRQRTGATCSATCELQWADVCGEGNRTTGKNELMHANLGNTTYCIQMSY